MQVVAEQITAKRRTKNEEWIPKQQEISTKNSVRQSEMQIENFIHRHDQDEGKRKSKKQLAKRTIGGKMLAPWVLTSKVEQYDLLASLTEANVGLNLCHLFCVGREHVIVAAEKLSSGRSVHILLAAIEGSGRIRNPVRYNPKKLKLFKVHVHGTTIRTLFNSGANLKVMCVALC